MRDNSWIMHIKRLEIQGFKTFADRTDLELTAGITAVVGPNGSGKSNIADAISWVLGEQNVRNLRGAKSQDVIFAGSERRKPLGFAEVSLTIDNACGSLPINFNEVTVTRRVHRSGDSEYFINKSSCRLKDIFELFLDTGMGREAYSMVTQGEIDAILSVKGEDRRSLFEEAAGIKKYRFRRKEAARKLENTETNLRRVHDIISELSGQVEPLEEQAILAERYNELTTRLREIETGLLINDLRRWSTEMQRTRQTKVESAEAIKEQDKRIADLEWEKEKLTDQLAQLDHQVDSARSKHQETAAAAQRIKSQLALIEERQRSAKDARSRLDGEIQQLEKRLQESEERLQRLIAEESGCSEREKRLVEDVSKQSKSLEAVTSELESASRIVDNRKSAYVELAREQAAKRTEHESLMARQAELEVAIGKYSAELKTLEDNIADVSRRQKEFNARAEELRTAQYSRLQELPPLKQTRDESQSKLNKANEQLTDINRQTVGKSSRLSTLKEMAEAHEGFFEGVRAVAAAKKHGKLKGNYAVVADVITVPEGFETAIEVALGSAVQDVIADTVDEAKDAIRFLKENRAGRATFLPLNGIRPQNANISGSIQKTGFKGMASDIVSYDKKYSDAISVLLGRVVIVDNIDNAVQLSRGTSGWGRIVTLEGEVIVPTGAMTGGTKHGKGPNLLGRKQEMDALTKDLAQLDSARTKAEKEAEAAKESFATSGKRIFELEEAFSTDKVALVEAERQLDFLGREEKRLTEQIAVVHAEKEDVELSLEADSAALAAVEADLSAAGKENNDLDEFVAAAQKQVEGLTTKRESLSEDMMGMSVTLASIRERRTGFEQSIRQTRSQISDLGSELARRRNETNQKAVETTESVKQHESLVTQAKESEQTIAATQKSLDELLARRTQFAQSVTSADNELKTLHHGRAETAELLRDCEVREARLEIQISGTSDRLMEEYEISAEEALAREEPEQVERGTATEVNNLRREIKMMGPVNTGAIQEYERVKERWEFLTMQRRDLDEAREKLQDAIREIDDSTRDLFMNTFNTVGQHFDTMFKRLFNGGRTELVLTDPNNLLDTGVEVIVQPPGKKLQNLVLLSGGERALTASALLFALLMVRPSPFVLFDEVDAPLDDTNVERFADVLKEFAENSQFIIVTHNRSTMEACDTLYGVTMQEPGVSKLISVRLTNEAERKRTGQEIVFAADSRN